MSMDTTFPGNDLMYRSVTIPLWQIVYALIIATQLVVRRPVPRRRHADVACAHRLGVEFKRAKAFAIAGACSPSCSGFSSSW